jgi:hypothetical protein
MLIVRPAQCQVTSGRLTDDGGGRAAHDDPVERQDLGDIDFRVRNEGRESYLKDAFGSGLVKSAELDRLCAGCVRDDHGRNSNDDGISLHGD